MADQFQDGLQWACITDTNTQNALGKLKPAYALTGLNEAASLYTLPDFQLDTLNVANVRSLYNQKTASKYEHVNIDINKLQDYETWTPLKGNSKFLVVEEHLLTNIYENRRLADTMSQISQTLKISASENMLH